jgi:RNA polymerase sigma-70 factor (ECF subfamily)
VADHRENHRFAVARAFKAGADRSTTVKMPCSGLDRRPDASLMLLLKQGHTEALEVLYRRHRGVATSVAYRIVGDFATAEEVVQDAFVALWRESPSYEPDRGSVRSWVFGIVHHRAIDTQRQKARAERKRSLVESLPERFCHDTPELEVTRRDEARTTWEELDVLPPSQRQVIELAFLGELTCKEVAKLLELPLGTVKGRMRLGLDKMRRSLGGAARPDEVAL